MKPEIKTKWVAALRSGEYKQGTGQLRSDHTGICRYCCLGVLTDLATKAGVAKWGPEGVFEMRLFDPGDALLPSEVQEWAGLKSNDPAVEFEDRGWRSLWKLNDRQRLTFTELADLIEDQL